MIHVQNITKGYDGHLALNGLNLHAPRGAVYGLVGPNGAGKTTAIKMLCCLTAPTEGDALVLGNSITHHTSAVKAVIGVSPQETALAPNLSVRENLEFLCGIYGLTGKTCEERIREITKEFCLEEVLERKAGKLSGGWQRRVSIAMARISAPPVLFLDEPKLGLDVIARSEVWDGIRALKGKTTILLTTHYMEEAQALADRAGIMKDGKLLALGTVAELMEKACADSLENAFITLIKEANV